MITRPVAILAAVILLVAAGVFFLKQDGDAAQKRYVYDYGVTGNSAVDNPEAPNKSVATARPPGATPAWEQAVRRAAKLADDHGGTTTVAVQANDWSKPAVAGPTSSRHRMWSLSKPVAAVALLSVKEESGEEPATETGSAMSRAIVRSENCRQREVVASLQEATGGATAAAERVRETLAEAGADNAEVSDKTVPPAGACRNFLSGMRGVLKNPTADAIQLGVATWTTRDAVAFAHHLCSGGYGVAGDEVLDLMRIPKRVSSELASPSEFTANPDWGAGTAFSGMAPAYKSGWGGAEQQNFVASQIACVDSGDQTYAIAVTFSPESSPPSDDPGLTEAPSALKSAMQTLRAQM